MGTDEDFLGRLGPELRLVLPMLDERSRRLMLGMAARAAGDGGTAAVAALAGASWRTVSDGAAEIGSGETAPEGRVRRPGGGRKPLPETGPGFPGALLALVKDSVKGDPESPLEWTTKSVRKLSDELRAQGHPCAPATCWRALRAQGYRTQGNHRAAEGRQHPDRDAQFRYIAALAKEHRDAGQPVISVDAKKKEQVGNYAQEGAEWRGKGDPVQVRSHDFPEKDGQHAIPYGIYDENANTGFVNVGTDGNTAALAVESIRRWYRLAGQDAYPDATRLLVTCDAGGSSGHSDKAWKAGLAELAAETGLEITVCHFPPGTSKWNQIEHRLFCQITLGWRGRPLTSYDVIINTISAVTTRTGLAVTAFPGDNDYPTGLQISDAQMKDLEDRFLTRHEFHGGWNYTLLPVPRPAPEPEPEPERPGRCSKDALNHPALTGMDPGDLHALAAALDIPFRARREQRLCNRRKRGRTNAEGASPPRKIDLTDHVIATLMRRHLNLPAHVIAALLGVTRPTVSIATSLTAELLAGIPQPAAGPPAAIRLRTLGELREYAARHGITITVAPLAAATPPDNTLTTPGTPQTPVNLKRCLQQPKLTKGRQLGSIRQE